MKNKMTNFLTGFKDFAMRGNVIDLAVGVIIGGAFGKITTALVNNVIMPIFGLILGGVNFAELSVILREEVIENGVVVTTALRLEYGLFLQAVVDFIIIAFSIFCMITLLGKLKREKVVEEEKAVEAKPSTEDLLIEIRDLLKEKK